MPGRSSIPFDDGRLCVGTWQQIARLETEAMLNRTAIVPSRLRGGVSILGREPSGRSPDTGGLAYAAPQMAGKASAGAFRVVVPCKPGRRHSVGQMSGMASRLFRRYTRKSVRSTVTTL